MRYILALACICLIDWRVCPRLAVAQSAKPPLLASAKLLDDVDILKRVYESAHPGLYRYNTKTRMEEHFAALRAEFRRDRTLTEAYIAISRFLAKIQCGHTYANFFNQPKEVVEALFAGKNRVPFCFRWIGGKMIVTRDLSPTAVIAPGTEIVAINGIPVSDMLEKLLAIARADGSNDAKRVAYLEVQGTSRYEAFDIFLPLFFPGIGERMDLLARPMAAAGAVHVAVTAQDLEQRKALAKSNREPQRGEAGPLWRFERIEQQIALLRMPNWALYDSKWDWRGFLEKGIDELIDQRVSALIVDLRGNEGGQDIGNALIARIIAKPVRADRYRRYTRYRVLPLPKSFEAYLDTWDWSFKDWGQAAKDERLGFFRMTRFDDDEQGDVIASHGRRFEGRVIVLIDASNSSATFQFAQVVKENRLATLVGQPTGGNQRGINGGAFFFVTLPNSRIEVDLPLVGNFIGDERPTGERIPFLTVPNAGIEPDVVVLPSARDIASGRDAELQAAVALIKPAKTTQ